MNEPKLCNDCEGQPSYDICDDCQKKVDAQNKKEDNERRKSDKIMREKINEWLGHTYTTCPWCVNRLRYCGCAEKCSSCGEHITTCQKDQCKRCEQRMKRWN